jgi:hypothetical protein
MLTPRPIASALFVLSRTVSLTTRLLCVLIGTTNVLINVLVGSIGGLVGSVVLLVVDMDEVDGDNGMLVVRKAVVVVGVGVGDS